MHSKLRDTTLDVLSLEDTISVRVTLKARHRSSPNPKGKGEDELREYSRAVAVREPLVPPAEIIHRYGLSPHDKNFDNPTISCVITKQEPILEETKPPSHL